MRYSNQRLVSTTVQLSSASVSSGRRASADERTFRSELLGKVASSGGGLTTNTRRASCDSDGSSVRLRFSFAGTMYWPSALTKPVHTKPTTQVRARGRAANAGPRSRLLFGRAPWNQYRSTAAYAKDFFKEETAPGLAATTPSFVVCAKLSEEPCRIGASQHLPKDSSSRSPSATCVTATGGT